MSNYSHHFELQLYSNKSSYLFMVWLKILLQSYFIKEKILYSKLQVKPHLFLPFKYQFVDKTFISNYYVIEKVGKYS